MGGEKSDGVAADFRRRKRFIPSRSDDERRHTSTTQATFGRFARGGECKRPTSVTNATTGLIVSGSGPR